MEIINNGISDEKKISIIVPVYNSEKYISACIESVLNQEYQNWELILVDDESSDSSMDICSQYSNDQRIILAPKRHAGVAEARNYGLKMACGSYIIFLDSDDELEKHACENLINSIEETDLCVSGYKRLYSSGKEEFMYSSYYQGRMEDMDYYFNEFMSKSLFQAPWCKLYKKKIIDDNNLSFPSDLSYGEDASFVYDYLSKANTLTVIQTITYDYYVRGNSLSHGLKKNQYSIHLFLDKKVMELRKKWGMEYEKNYYADVRNSFSALINDTAYSDDLSYVNKTIKDALDNNETINAYQEKESLSYKQKALRLCVIRKSILLCKVLARFNKVILKFKR